MSDNSYSKFKVSNETRAQRRCFWGHVFDASVTTLDPRCPHCGSGTDYRAKCEVCGIAFVPNDSAAGGRRAKVCSVKCRVRKHRVTKLGPKESKP